MTCSSWARITLVALCAVLGAGQSIPTISSRFSNWLQQWGKTYSNIKELIYRQTVFLANCQIIDAHNALYPLLTRYQMNTTFYADLTASEFASQVSSGVLGSLPHRRQLRGDPSAHWTNTSVVRERLLQGTVDWVALGAVTPPMNENGCSCSYAFAAAAAIEGVTFVRGGQLPTVSVQELVDCTGNYGSYGCAGGYVDGALQYVVDRHMISRASDYPYIGSEGYCMNQGKQPATSISGYTYVPAQSDGALAQAAASWPVAVLVNAANTAFQFYSSGVVDDASTCSSSVTDAAAVVGFGSTGGFGSVNYFKLKYNLGPNWGEGGFIRIKRDPTANFMNGVCGIYVMPVAAQYN